MSKSQVVITGGTGALGQAVVKHFIDAGATCTVTWKYDAELEAFPYTDQVQLREVDCMDEDAVTAFYESLPSIDASIHLVGGFEMAPITDTRMQLLERMFRLNTASAFLCCRESVRAMRARGSGGRIVNISARPAVQPTGGMLAYTTSKAAVAALTQGLAEEVRDDGILVNAVLPSIMDTPQNRAAMPKADHSTWPRVEQVAEVIGFLAGKDNALTTGALLPVFGRA
jgi:NAD(P)-dependent dehydrogenase (short-subunit alcohol dehydrogenase family)